MYCPDCGTELIEKECGIDGMIPFCPHCNSFKFPTFNSAISTIIVNPDRNKILLIRQYGKAKNILVAGYLMKGENTIETLRREIKEEVGLEISQYFFNDSEYFAPSNTVMNNFVCIATSEEFTLTDEVDHAEWYSFEEAKKAIYPNSLAERFLLHGFQTIIDKDFVVNYH